MRRFLLIFAIAICFTTRANAQWVAGADTLSPRAVSDSQAILRELNARVRSSPNDATLRFRVGTIAWTLSVRDQFKPSIGNLNGLLLRALADSSLRLAAQLDPSNAKYELTLGRFLRASSDPVLRLTAPAHAERAVVAARAGTDTTLLFASLVEQGRLHWLMYDSEAYETPPYACQGVPTSIQTASTSGGFGDAVPTPTALKVFESFIQSCMRPARNVGELDLLKAEDLFREAHTLRPADAGAFRRLAMVYGELGRWREVASLARDRSKRVPEDAWSWLTLGLALQRSGEHSQAAATFDTAMKKLDKSERDRLFSLERLLSRPDSESFAAMKPDQRAAREKSLWAMTDPLWSREGGDPRTEFLTRVAYAELRWTVEEFKVRGTDSDRGQIHIRYGSPEGIWTFRCYDGINCSGGGSQPLMGQFLTIWHYTTGLTLAFFGAPTYGTASFPQADGPHIENVIAMQPANFDNAVPEKISELPVRLLRFRAPADSVDLFAFSQAPMDSIRSATSNAQVIAHSWLLRRNATSGIRDSSVVPASGAKRAIYRVAPAQYMYRLETTAEGTLFAGRAIAWVVADRDSTTGFDLHGFGMSDIILARAADPAAPLPARWRGLAVAPLLGSIPRGSAIDLIWETYDIGSRGGQSNYTVSVTLQRQRSRGGKIAAALLGVASGAIGVDRRDDRVTFTFDRIIPAAPSAFVDRMSLSTGDTPPGDYLVTVELTDKVSGRKTRRSLTLTILQ